MVFRRLIMLIFCFICSICFSILLLAFIVGVIVSLVRMKNQKDNFNELINGFKTYDLNDSIHGGIDEEK